MALIPTTMCVVLAVAAVRALATGALGMDDSLWGRAEVYFGVLSLFAMAAFSGALAVGGWRAALNRPPRPGARPPARRHRRRSARADRWAIRLFGLVFLVMCLGLTAYGVQGLLAGEFVESDDEVVYASEEPGYFYFSTLLILGMGVYGSYLGFSMLRHR
ncbi:MAG TPA: hypothetical protein VFX98_01345 [Longimicrobiaceae bacterium]|nr:hypothetical protein [Longimicrobiaceae bacterium]